MTVIIITIIVILSKMLLSFILISMFGCTITTQQYDSNQDYYGSKNEIKLWLTISAKSRLIEVSWINAASNSGDEILITPQQPFSFEKIRVQDSLYRSKRTSFLTDIKKFLSVVPLNDDIKDPQHNESPFHLTKEENSYSDKKVQTNTSSFIRNNEYWISNNGANTVLESIKVQEDSKWVRTSIPFDYSLLNNITIHTKCYGYWASYVDRYGTIYAVNCIRNSPTWMNEMRAALGGFRLRDLFIPGTHDSGSYRPNFDPLINDTIVTKYTLTQDEDIRGQLMHGARYLDIRVGHYRSLSEPFWANHGISRQRPLSEVLNQVRDFVLETNEIVILDIQEFPVGFGRDLSVHRRLVQYLHSKLGDVFVDPALTWQATLHDIWRQRQNVIISYDHVSVVTEFSNILFRSVEQKWGNVRSLSNLIQFLRRANQYDPMRLSSRPTADMAELTPDAWGVVLDRYGGLRNLADQVNEHISNLYRTDLGPTANVVAVDFIRGTNIVELAIQWNSRKVLV